WAIWDRSPRVFTRHAKIGDEGYLLVDPFRVQGVVRGIYLVASEMVPNGATGVFLTTMDVNGEIVSGSVPVTLESVPGDVARIAEFDLTPIGYDYQGSYPWLEVQVGDGVIEANLPGAKTGSDANAGSTSTRRDMLRIRFRKRDGSGQLTGSNGAEQETLIGNIDQNYAEITHLRIELVDPNDLDGPPLNRSGDRVAIVEKINDKWGVHQDWTQQTKLFFDGVNDTTSCNNGSHNVCKVDRQPTWGGSTGAKITLNNGLADVVLASNSVARRLDGSGMLFIPEAPPDPDDNWLSPGEALYQGEDAVVLVPVFNSDRDVPAGEEFELKKWIDERSVEVYDKSPAGTPMCNWRWKEPNEANGVRDWLEAKMWDFYCFQAEQLADTPEEQAALDSLRPAIEYLDGFGEHYSAGSLRGKVRGDVAPTTTTHHTILWNPVSEGLRNPTGNHFTNPENGALYTVTSNIYEYLFRHHPSIEYIYQLDALHELRHVQQWSLIKSDEGGHPDGDVDGIPDSGISVDLSELRDSPHKSAGGDPQTGNTDFHFRGVDLSEPNLEYWFAKRAFERDAVRHSMVFNSFARVPGYDPVPDKMECRLTSPELLFSVPVQVGQDAEFWAYVKYLAGSGEDEFLGGLPILWGITTTDKCALVVDSSQVFTTVSRTGELMQYDPQGDYGSLTTPWYSKVSIRGLQAGTCELSLKIIDPVSPAPEDCSTTEATVDITVTQP
ncbi:MAG: hypothetical protein ACC655_05625, partial [Rhodothermia bacterium]